MATFSKLPAHCQEYMDLQFFAGNQRWRGDNTPVWFKDVWDRYVSEGPHVLWAAVAMYVSGCESRHQHRRMSERVAIIKEEYRAVQNVVQTTGELIFRLSEN